MKIANYVILIQQYNTAIYILKLYIYMYKYIYIYIYILFIYIKVCLGHYALKG